MNRAGLVASLCCALVANEARAQAPPARVAVRLDYAAASGCPDESELRGIVASRMGYDPFASQAVASVLRVSITRSGDGFSGVVEHRDLQGRLLWDRPPLVEATCRRIVETFGEVSIPIAIEPAPRRAPPAQPPAPAAASPPAQPAPSSPAPPALPPAAPPAPSVPRPTVRIGARGAVAFGTAPTTTGAFTVDLGLGWKYFSVALEGRADVPVTGELNGGTQLQTSLLAGSLVPCGHYGWFFGCAVISAGRIQWQSPGFDAPEQGALVYIATGLRAGLEWPVGRIFALRASVDLLLQPPLTFGFHLLDGTAWRPSLLAGMVGAGVVVHLPEP